MWSCWNSRSFVGRGESRHFSLCILLKLKSHFRQGFLGLCPQLLMIFRTGKGGRLAHWLFPHQKHLSRVQWNFSKAYTSQLEQQFLYWKGKGTGFYSSCYMLNFLQVTILYRSIINLFQKQDVLIDKTDVNIIILPEIAVFDGSSEFLQWLIASACCWLKCVAGLHHAWQNMSSVGSLLFWSWGHFGQSLNDPKHHHACRLAEATSQWVNKTKINNHHWG